MICDRFSFAWSSTETDCMRHFSSLLVTSLVTFLKSLFVIVTGSGNPDFERDGYVEAYSRYL